MAILLNKEEVEQFMLFKGIDAWIILLLFYKLEE